MTAVWEKIRRKTAAFTVVGTVALATGVAAYKYYIVSRPPPIRKNTQKTKSESTQTSKSSNRTRKRKTNDEEKNEVSGAFKRSRLGSASSSKKAPNSLHRPASDNAEGYSTKCGPEPQTSPFSTPPSSSTKFSNRSQTSTAHSSIDSEDEKEYPGARFDDVRAVIKFEALATAALRVRKQNFVPGDDTCHDQNTTDDGLTCKVEDSPLFGSYNIVFPVIFSDGVRWLVRIPGHGHQLTGLDKVKMESEYQTMRYVKVHTTIPLPTVYHWILEASEVGSAYAFMEYLPGQQLCHVWKDSLDERHRLRVLHNIAQLMSQLQFAHFSQIGMLRFKEDGSIYEVGAEIVLDESFESVLPWDNGSKTVGPYTTLQQGLRENWDDYFEPGRFREADASLLSIALDSIPKGLLPEGRNAINMADLDSQNILVDDNGCVTGLIDWDGTGPCPASVGCARYPSWLMDDWRPWYDYDSKRWVEDQHEPSPEEMMRYRKFYSDSFARYSRDVPEYDPRMTRMSHILWAIQIAISSSLGRSEMIHKILSHAFGANPSFEMRNYCIAFDTHDTQQREQYDELLRKAFARMWHAEWEVSDWDDQDRVE